MAVQWWRIKKAYLSGGMTYKQLSEKYNVPVKTIQNRASNEGWPKEKGKIREEIGNELRARVVREKVNHLEKLIVANDTFIEALVKLTETVQQKPNAKLYDANGTLRNAESLAKAINTAVLTQRDLRGMKNIDQKFAEKKWRDQKKLEKEKLAGPQYDEEVWEIQAPEGDVLDG